LRRNGLLHEITEGSMEGKPITGMRRIQLLHAVAVDLNSFSSLIYFILLFDILLPPLDNL